MAHLYLYLPAVLILLGTPGPTNTLLWAAGAACGVRRSLPLLAGELGGYLCAIGTIVLVVGPLMEAVPALQRFLALAAAVYITILAVALWRRAQAMAASGAVITPGKVFLVTLLNPKAFVFALTIIPVGHERVEWYFALLSGCILVVGYCWITFGHLVGTVSGSHRVVWINRISSAALGLFACLILFSAFWET